MGSAVKADEQSERDSDCNPARSTERETPDAVLEIGWKDPFISERGETVHDFQRTWEKGPREDLGCCHAPPECGDRKEGHESCKRWPTRCPAAILLQDLSDLTHARCTSPQ